MNLQLNAKLQARNKGLAAISRFTLFLRINKFHGSINGQYHYFCHSPSHLTLLTFSNKNPEGRKAFPGFVYIQAIAAAGL